MEWSRGNGKQKWSHRKGKKTFWNSLWISQIILGLTGIVVLIKAYCSSLDTPTIQTLNASHCSTYIWAEFGASKGAGIRWVKDVFDIEAIGVDIDKNKVSACLEYGESCILGDLMAPNIPDHCFSVVSMMHVLEHLPSRAKGIEAIASVMRIASDMVLVRGPLWNTKRFVGTDLGLYFSNWKGHRSKADLSDVLKGITLSGRSATMKAYALSPIYSSNASEIIPIDADTLDAPGYHPNMGTKEDIVYTPPIYKELFVIIDMQEAPDPNGMLVRQHLDDYIDTFVIGRRGGVLIGEYASADGMHYTRGFQKTMLED